jgi:hypothetical protein
MILLFPDAGSRKSDADPMTDRLYYHDSFLYDFDAETHDTSAASSAHTELNER